MVVGENKRTNIMDGIENTGDVRMHDHRLRLKQRFDIVRKLGQGTYGKVQLGINKKTGQEVAIKTIKKCKIESEADLVRIRREVQIMSSVRHPNIVHIYEVFENSEKMILVMEYCSGGELYDYLSQKKVLEEDEARRLFRQIATAVYYCHIHKICHRDLKLENVLLDDTGSAKIADFGLSNVFKETSLLSTFCGSPLYASPEIVKGTPYIGPEVDCWSLGVLLYTLVYGAMPFDGSNFKRLVRQISNGDYYEPKSPSSASPLIRDMLTVDPLKRADIAYICDNSWVNAGCEISCLEEAEALAAETPVRLDLLLSLAPAAPNNSNSVVVPSEGDLGPEESGTDLTGSSSMAVEPSNSAEKRILELVAEGGEDAIKPSPTRTIVSAGDNKRKLELAMSASGLQKKKDRVASSASIGPQASLPEEACIEPPTDEQSVEDHEIIQPSLKSSATITIAPSPAGLVSSATVDLVKETKDEVKEKAVKPHAPGKSSSPTKTVNEKLPTEKQDVTKVELKTSSVSSASDKLTSLSLASASAPAPAPVPAPSPAKPKKISIGGSVGSFKEQFERRASVTTAPDVKRNLTKPVGSKIAKPKAQSEDRELSMKAPDNGTVRLQQIGIEPSRTPIDEGGPPTRHVTGGVKKTESEPTHNTVAADTSVLLQDARRSLQSSMAKLVEEKANEEHRRRAARDIISSAIRTGKPPMPYGRSSSAGVTSLTSPPGTPPAAPPTAPPTAPSRLYRTEAQHRVEDHRNRGVSVERIIPIHVAPEDTPTSPPPLPKPAAVTSPLPNQVPLRRLVSTESSGSGAGSEAGEPIKKSPREFIIPIAVEGKGYVTPRQRSLEPEQAAPHTPLTPHAPPSHRRGPHKRGPLYGSIVSGGESDEEDDTHSMHRLRSSRAARAESVSSGEEDEEDERFHLLTAENLFSTLLHRVRALTNRLNGEEGPGFPQHPHSLLQSPFFNSPHLPRRHLLREGWGSRDFHSDFDSIFNKSRQQMPRGNNKKSGKHQAKSNQNAETNTESGLDLSDLDLSSIQFSEKEMQALSGLTPALSRRLQRQLLASLPPAAARTLRRTLSLHAAPAPPAASAPPAAPHRSRSSDAHVDPAAPRTSATDDNETPSKTQACSPSATPEKTDPLVIADTDVSAPQFCTLPRLKRHAVATREMTPPITPVSDTGYSYTPRMGTLVNDSCPSKGSSIRSTPDRPLLSKYLTPDRNLSLDESYSSDSGSILSEPSYIAAYGPSTIGSGFRRHSMRLSGDREIQRKRISRFLRPDFFDVPPDESLYAKHKKEKELETQKILKEIREKKNKANEVPAMRSSTETNDSLSLDNRTNEGNYNRKCLSPISILTSKERSRSITPFFPILDNIKETLLDSTLKIQEQNIFEDSKRSSKLENVNSESKLIRPKSYPVKNLDVVGTSDKTLLSDNIVVKENDNKDRVLHKDSKLIRPRSYPSSNSSPDKAFVNSEKEQMKNNDIKEESTLNENKSDIEVTFSFSLPKKNKRITTAMNVSNELVEEGVKSNTEQNNETVENSLTLKKYQIINDSIKSNVNTETKEANNDTNNVVELKNTTNSINNVTVNDVNCKEEIKSKVVENDVADKKGTIKKKIIRKVSSKSNSDIKNNLENSENKALGDKKKITKKVKDKNSEDSVKPTVSKKKSVLQSIGHKLEKLASTKSSSPEKNSSTSILETKKDSSKLCRTQREQSVPVNIEPTESNLIKRAVTLTDVAALDNHNINSNKTTVSKVLGLFKKFEPKEKSVNKIIIEKSEPQPHDVNKPINTSVPDSQDKPKRPTSLLLNGCKSNYEKSASEEVSRIAIESDNHSGIKKEHDPKTLRNSLKLDFSRLPRVKKIVPTNPVIEPQFINVSPTDKDTEIKEKASILNDSETSEILKRCRSRSKSILSNSDHAEETKSSDKLPLSPTDTQPPLRNRESTSPEKEDIVDRIRRKSFYSRFNEKKQRRKSNLVGPGATEYDPVARLHGPSTDTKYDLSPTSGAYDLSPGFSNVSDLSPPTERYRPLLNELSIGAKNNSRYDNFSLNDKLDTYRSLDRNDFRKYPGNKSYLDYIQPSSFGSNRYSRTKSLLDSSEEPEDHSILNHQRDPHKYNRTISMYSPGSYATYRPKRTRNSAIILKESEKEPSPENIMEKIRQRKNISISVTRKPESEKNTLPRSNISSKGENDGTECSQKID